MLTTTKFLTAATVLTAALGLGGCGGFAFYEDTKLAIALTLDPSAPDPVEITAAFKEGVFVLAPVKQKDDVIATGPILTDFDVRHGVNANRASGTRDILYAVITHGLATGSAAVVRNDPSGVFARKTIIMRFIDTLGETELRTAGSAIGAGGQDSPTALRRGIAKSIRDKKTNAEIAVVENSLKTRFRRDKRPGSNALSSILHTDPPD